MANWNEITAAISLALGGDPGRGRHQLMDCWADTTAADHAHRCVLAHYLADLQTELDREIAWDRIALEEHALVDDGDLAAVGIASARAMAPSLHLNLGDGHLRRGDVQQARDHLRQGLFTSTALETDGYGAMIRSGLQSLAQRIEAISKEA
jgi:hypothetical protein